MKELFMKLTHYGAFILLISASLCQANPTPSRNKLALSGITDATLALLAGYAAVHTAKTFVGEFELDGAKELFNDLYTERGFYRALSGAENRANWGYQIVRPLAYASLFYTTGRVAVTRGISAYKLLKEAYIKHLDEVKSPVVEVQKQS